MVCSWCIPFVSWREWNCRCHAWHPLCMPILLFPKMFLSVSIVYGAKLGRIVGKCHWFKAGRLERGMHCDSSLVPRVVDVGSFTGLGVHWCVDLTTSSHLLVHMSVPTVLVSRKVQEFPLKLMRCHYCYSFWIWKGGAADHEWRIAENESTTECRLIMLAPGTCSFYE